MEEQHLRALAIETKKFFKRMFDVDILIDEENSYVFEPRPRFKTDNYAYIGIASEKFQGQIVMGFSADFPKIMVSKFLNQFPVEKHDNFSRSAICEVLNNLVGILGQHELFKDTFNEVSQTLPVINDVQKEGAVYFPKSEGGTVKFNFQDKTFYLFLSMKAFVSSQIKTNPDDILTSDIF